jgi:zinc transport system substrate-binding protein
MFGMTKYFHQGGPGMNRRKLFQFFTLCAILVLPFLGWGCSPANDVWPQKPGKRVLVSFPPLYCLTQKVAGDDANVLCLMTENSPHHYEVVYTDVLKVRKADLFLCNGLEMDEDFADKLAKTAGLNKNKVILVADDAIPHEKLLHIEHEEHDHGKKDKHHHHHGEHDPHVWLSPPLAMDLVDKIASALSKSDPAHKNGYQERAAKYKSDLKKVHEDGLAALKSKKNRKIVSQHDSLRYFAEAFELEIVGQIRLQSGIENDPKQMANLIKECRDKKVAVIAYEPQYPKTEVESLQNTLKGQGLNVTLAEVDPLETAPGNPNPDPDHYLKTMKRNIDNLVEALP